MRDDAQLLVAHRLHCTVVLRQRVVEGDLFVRQPGLFAPLSRGADGKLGVVAANGNSAPKVVINNYSGQEATASSDSAGNIVVEIGRAIAQDITSGGPTYRAIRTTFGLGNRLQQRG